MKDLPKNFTDKSQKCEIPKCYTKRYNYFDFLDKVTPVPNDTIRETFHEFTIRASEVNALPLCEKLSISIPISYFGY